MKLENLPKINHIAKNAQKSIYIVDAIETARKTENCMKYLTFVLQRTNTLWLILIEFLKFYQNRPGLIYILHTVQLQLLLSILNSKPEQVMVPVPVPIKAVCWQTEMV